MPLPSLFVPRAQVAHLDLSRHGFESLGRHNPAVPLSLVTEIAADVWSRHDIDLLVRTPASERNADPTSGYQRVAGAAFADAHDEAWWTTVHQGRQLVTFVGDEGPFLKNAWPPPNEMQLWLNDVQVAVLPLVIRAWNDGIGTARSDQ